MSDAGIDLDADLAAVRETAGVVMAVSSPQAAALIHELLQGGGKLLRSSLVVLTARMHGPPSESILLAAAAVELVHTASLVHDDIVDNSVERRGRPALHTQVGVGGAILLGDLFLMRAVHSLASADQSEAVKVLTYAMQAMAAAELVQRDRVGDPALPFSDYIEIVTGKSAALLSAALEIGGLVGGCSSERRTILRDIGTNLGIAFQILDDVRDYADPIDGTLRDPGSDAFQGRVTAPFILARERLPVAERERADLIIKKGAADLSEFAELTKLISGAHGLAMANDRGRGYLDTARDLMAGLPKSDARDRLEALVRTTFIF